MTSQNTIQTEEHIFPVYDLHNRLEHYVKHMTWNVGPYHLMISYFSEDKNNFSNEGHIVRIQNNSKFNIELDPIKMYFEPMEGEEYGECIYTGVEVFMFSNLAKTPEEMEELSEVMKYASEAQRVFADILKERF